MKCSVRGLLETKNKPTSATIPRAVISLRLYPTKYDDSGNGEKRHNDATARKLIHKHIIDAENIIRDSLYGVCISELNIDINTLTACFVAIPEKKYIGHKYKYGKGTDDDFIYDIKDNYGDGAVDTWMEGDIRFPKNNKNGELWLELTSIKIIT